MEGDGMGDDDDLKWRFRVEALTRTQITRSLGSLY